MHLASERSFSVVNSCHSSLSSYITHVQKIANKKKQTKKKEKRLGGCEDSGLSFMKKGTCMTWPSSLRITVPCFFFSHCLLLDCSFIW